LTLFLALHFSVGARLPWLVLDDPVQNMDLSSRTYTPMIARSAGETTVKYQKASHWRFGCSAS